MFLMLLETDPSTLFVQFFGLNALGQRSELTKTPKSLSHPNLLLWVSFKQQLCERLFHPTLTILHFPTFNSICHLPVQSCHLFSWPWKIPVSYSDSITLSILVLSAEEGKVRGRSRRGEETWQREKTHLDTSSIQFTYAIFSFNWSRDIIQLFHPYRHIVIMSYQR